MSAAPAIVPDSEEQWRAIRRELVTASDAAAILGADTHRGPLSVYADKVSGIEQEDRLPMRRGRRFEAAIADEYGEQMRRPVEPLRAFEISLHPDLPWLGATLDRLTLGTLQAPDPFGGCDTRGPLQIKMAIGSASEWSEEDPPLRFVIQVQIEMACYGARWGSLCALTGPGPLKVHDLERDDAFLAEAIPRLEEFRDRVRRREPPPADALPETARALSRLWPADDGSTVLLDRAALDTVNRWEAAQAREQKAAAEAAAATNELHRRLGPAAFGSLPDGSYLSLKTTRRGGYTVKPARYRTLRHFWPRLLRR